MLGHDQCLNRTSKITIACATSSTSMLSTEWGHTLTMGSIKGIYVTQMADFSLEEQADARLLNEKDIAPGNVKSFPCEGYRIFP